jgi:hypothetical protein
MTDRHDPAFILLEHDAWCTNRLLAHSEKLTTEQLHQRFDIGLGSLHDRFLHIIAAMVRWAQRGQRIVRARGRRRGDVARDRLCPNNACAHDDHPQDKSRTQSSPIGNGTEIQHVGDSGLGQASREQSTRMRNRARTIVMSLVRRGQSILINERTGRGLPRGKPLRSYP